MPETMRLRVLCPTAMIVDRHVTRVVAESPTGSFGILPRHIDGAAALAAGLMIFSQADADHENYLAVDGGVLVKCADEVTVSTPDAVSGQSLESMEAVIAERFAARDEQARLTRSALARLEAGTLRRFQDLEQWSG